MTVGELRDRLTEMMNQDVFCEVRQVRIYDADSKQMEIITGFETGACVLDILSDTQGG